MSHIGKTLGLLAAFLIMVTGVVVYFALNDAETPLPGFTQSDARLIPEDGFRPSDIATIEIATNATSMRLRKTDAGWAHATKEDYPVKDGFADELIERLTKARVLYEKRIEHEEMHRFGLQPVTEPGSSAARVSLRDAGDDSLLNVRIGNQMSLPGGPDVETLATLPSERLIVVLDRNLLFPWTADSWLQPLDLALSKGDLSRVEIGADVDRPEQQFRWAEERIWLLVDPSGQDEVVENQSVMEILISGLLNLEPEDVRRSEIPSRDIQWRRTVRLQTSIGPRIEYDIVRTADATWSRVSMESDNCSDKRQCGMLEQKIRSLADWWLKIPVSTGSGIELASALGSE